MAGAGLTELLRMLGEQANQEVDSAEVTVRQCGQPGPNLWLQLHLIQPGHTSDAICIHCYIQAALAREASP